MTNIRVTNWFCACLILCLLRKYIIRPVKSHLLFAMLMRTVLNNVVLPTLFIVVNNTVSALLQQTRG